jgi:hypothetical protein
MSKINKNITIKNLYHLALHLNADSIEKANLQSYKQSSTSLQKMAILIQDTMKQNKFYRSLVRNYNRI